MSMVRYSGSSGNCISCLACDTNIACWSLELSNSGHGSKILSFDNSVNRKYYSEYVKHAVIARNPAGTVKFYITQLFSSIDYISIVSF